MIRKLLIFKANERITISEVVDLVNERINQNKETLSREEEKDNYEIREVEKSYKQIQTYMLSNYKLVKPDD